MLLPYTYIYEGAYVCMYVCTHTLILSYINMHEYPSTLALQDNRTGQNRTYRTLSFLLVVPAKYFTEE